MNKLVVYFCGFNTARSLDGSEYMNEYGDYEHGAQTVGKGDRWIYFDSEGSFVCFQTFNMDMLFSM